MEKFWGQESQQNFIVHYILAIKAKGLYYERLQRWVKYLDTMTNKENIAKIVLIQFDHRTQENLISVERNHAFIKAALNRFDYIFSNNTVNSNR